MVRLTVRFRIVVRAKVRGQKRGQYWELGKLKEHEQRRVEGLSQVSQVLVKVSQGLNQYQSQDLTEVLDKCLSLGQNQGFSHGLSQGLSKGLSQGLSHDLD